jgi:hypothetical protein
MTLEYCDRVDRASDGKRPDFVPDLARRLLVERDRHYSGDVGQQRSADQSRGRSAPPRLQRQRLQPSLDPPRRRAARQARQRPAQPWLRW